MKEIKEVEPADVPLLGSVEIAILEPNGTRRAKFNRLELEKLIGRTLKIKPYQPAREVVGVFFRSAGEADALRGPWIEFNLSTGESKKIDFIVTRQEAERSAAKVRAKLRPWWGKCCSCRENDLAGPEELECEACRKASAS